MSRIHITSSDILRVLDGGRRLTVMQLMSKFGVSHPTGLWAPIKELTATGELNRRREHVELDGESSRAVFVYFTSVLEPVGKPYRDMHLTECLVGYESTMRRHADLCMAIRRAV